MAEGTEFEIDIDVRSDTVESAAAKLERLQSRLADAGSAAAKAAEATRAGQAAYADAERAASAAALAVERIGQKADAQRGKLAAAMQAGDDRAAARASAAIEKLNAEQSKAQGLAESAKAALAGQAAALDKLTAAEQKAKAEVTALEKAQKAGTTAFNEIKKAAPTGKVNEVAEALGKMGGPLGTAGQRAFGLADAWKKLGSSLGSAGPYVAIAVAIVAISTAVAAATIATLKWAISLADANRTQSLLSQGIAKSVAGGEALQSSIEDLASRVPLTTDELRSMAQKLADAGLTGKALTDQLEKTAVAAAQAKFGPDFAKQMLSLDQQATRFKSNISGLFGGLKIEGVLEGLSTLIALFDKNTESGRAMKVVFESIFQPLTDNIAGAATKAERFFLQLEIWALKALIGLKPYSAELSLLGQAFLIIGGAVVLAIGLVVGVIAGAVAAVAAFVAAGIWLEDQMKAVGTSIREFFSGLDLSKIGSQIIQGLINGITGAGPGVVNAIGGVASGAITAAKSALGIASPSKVFKELGEFTGEGMAIGVDASAGGVQDSVEAMVEPPAIGGSGASAVAAPTGAGSSLNLAGASFNFYGVQGAEDAESRLGAMLTRLLEGDASQLGAEVPV